MNRSLMVKLAIPAAGAVLIGLFALVRATTTPGVREERKAPPVAGSTSRAPGPEAPPRLAPPEKIARSTDHARLESTYQNYRNAVAAGNTVLADALRKVLARDQDAALVLAREELRRAATPLDRDIAHRTLESLRK